MSLSKAKFQKYKTEFITVAKRILKEKLSTNPNTLKKYEQEVYRKELVYIYVIFIEWCCKKERIIVFVQLKIKVKIFLFFLTYIEIKQ